MLVGPTDSHDPEGERPPSFTLGTALALLGHHCQGICPGQAVHRSALVWFDHLPVTSTEHQIQTLVEVDFGAVPWTRFHTDALLAAINLCVHPDRIAVRRRLELTVDDLLQS
jgi:hypothetical protein